MKSSTQKTVKKTNKVNSDTKTARKDFIKWLASLPPCELSDEMLEFHNQMTTENKSVEWFEFTILDKCEEEVDSLIEWNQKL